MSARTQLWPLILTIGWLVFAGAAGAADLPKPWVELDADGALSVRTVVARGAPCPAVTADGSSAATQKRGTPDERFPIEVCEARVPASTKKLEAAGAPLPTLAADVRRIVVIGDTGCRLEGKAIQDCNDTKAWPFAPNARLAAARKPDLVIHVGDYYYRESACPAGRGGCAGSPHGDNWGAWQADLFDPGAPLLAAAPWVMTRGNHESCRRGGQGWFRLLEPRPMPAGCADTTEPYRLSIGGLNLLIFDSTDADDFKTVDTKVAAYAGQMKSLLDNAPPHSWLVTHRPVWAMAQGQLSGINSNLTLQAAIRDHIPAGLDMVVAGHIHDFLSYTFGPERPAQLVAGTGGDTLIELGKAPIVGAEIDGLKVTKGFAMATFGYFVLDRAAEGWDGVFYSTEDTVLARCALRGRDLDCH